MAKWCTVTTTDGDGRRYSLDIQAGSSYDAAHLYLCHVLHIPGCGFPIPTTATTFEVVADGKILTVSGIKLRQWIQKRREEWKGPRGLPFKEAAGYRGLRTDDGAGCTSRMPTLGAPRSEGEREPKAAPKRNKKRG